MGKSRKKMGQTTVLLDRGPKVQWGGPLERRGGGTRQNLEVTTGNLPGGHLGGNSKARMGILWD